MNDEPDDFFAGIQAIARDMEQWVAQATQEMANDLAKEFNRALDDLIDLSDALSHEFDAIIRPELEAIEEQVQAFLTPLLDDFWEIDHSLDRSFDDLTQPFTSTFEPLINQHPACMGCQHYHGQSYNGVPFICAMHPYGWDSEPCPDWESFFQQ